MYIRAAEMATWGVGLDLIIHIHCTYEAYMKYYFKVTTTQSLTQQEPRTGSIETRLCASQ